MFSHDEYKVDQIKITAGEKVDSEEDIKTISVYMAPSSEKNGPNGRADRH